MVSSAGTPRPVARLDRTPPYSDEAEKGVLGAILFDFSRALDLAIESQITPEAFYVPAHRTIYVAMLELQQAGQIVDTVTLSDRLRSGDRLEAAGGTDYIEQLLAGTLTVAYAGYYIDIVRQRYLLRCIINTARDAEIACYDEQDSADKLLSDIEQRFLDITEHQHGSVIIWSHAIQEVMEHVEKVFTTKRSIGNAISTGFANLDSKLNGLRAGEMVVLAARPSMGKTSLAMNIAEHVALGHHDPDGRQHAVAIFSLEMSYESLVLRMLCCRAEVSGFKLTGGYVSNDIHRRLTAAAADLSKASLFIDDSGGLDVMELRARARRMKKKYGIELIIIDYLQLLNCREVARQGRQLETSAISQNIKAMAKELKLPVIVLSQLSRAPEQRSGGGEGKPKLSDLRDSGAIEQDADVVMMLRRPCKYPGTEGCEDETLAMVDVVKQRNGPTGEVMLNFEDDFTRFRDRAHGVDGFQPEAAVPDDEEYDV